MADFYHLDSTRVSLRTHQVLDLLPLPLEERSPEECEELMRWYPAGVSRFGLGVVHKQPTDWTAATLRREVELERVRRAHFPHLPSRCVSVFACENVEDIVRLQWQFVTIERPYPHGCIWKIEGTAPFWGDMNWFVEYNLRNEQEYVLRAYWSQERSERPLIEYLLAPPVTVLEKIRES